MRRAAGTASAALAVTGLLGGVAAWSGGFGARIGGADLHVLYLARYRHTAEAILAGRVPLWNPYEYCGQPLLATAHGGVLYLPAALANMALSPMAALQALYQLHLAALILVTLVYLARAGIPAVGGTAGALLAAASIFNGAAGAGRDHPNFLFSLLFVPVMLLALDALLAGRRRSAALLALAAGVQWLPGYPEFPMVTGPLLVAIAVASRGGTVAGRAVVAASLVAVGGLVGAAQTLPLAEAVGESTRHVAGMNPALPAFGVAGPGHLLDTSLARLGGAGVFAVLVGLLTPSVHRRPWMVGLGWALFATNWPLNLLYRVYPYSGLRFAFGWHHLAPFFAAYLAALGIGRLRRGGAEWWPAAIGGTLAVLALSRGERWAGAAAALSALGAIPGLRPSGGWAVGLVLIGVHAVGVMAGVGSEGGRPAPDLAALAPRVAALHALREALPGEPRVVSGPEVRAGLTLAERLPSPTGHEPAVPVRRISRLGMHLGLEALAFGWEGRTWPKLAAAPGAAAVMGIGLVALPPRAAPLLLRAGYEPRGVLPGGDVVLYRPPVPRARVVHAVRRATDEEESFRLVTAADFDPAETVVLEGDVPAGPHPPPPGAGEHVEVTLDEPERMRVRATLASPGVLVVRDTFFPGWEAWLDGAPAALLRADHAFRAVALGSGAHEVELVYRPRSVRLGGLLSAAGLLVVVLLALWPRGRRPGAPRGVRSRDATGAGP